MMSPHPPSSSIEGSTSTAQRTAQVRYLFAREIVGCPLVVRSGSLGVFILPRLRVWDGGGSAGRSTASATPLPQAEAEMEVRTGR